MNLFMHFSNYVSRQIKIAYHSPRKEVEGHFWKEPYQYQFSSITSGWDIGNLWVQYGNFKFRNPRETHITVEQLNKDIIITGTNIVVGTITFLWNLVCGEQLCD